MSKLFSLRALALGAATFALLSGPLASDALAIHAEDTPEWAAPQGFFVEPEAIFMQFTDSNLDFGAAFDGAAAEVMRIDGDYDAGWRFGIGYRWDNRWSLSARWTSIDNEESDSFSGKTGVANFLSWQDWSGSSYAVYGEVDRDLDIVDIEVGRTWGDLDGHHLKLFFGPRWMAYDEMFAAGTWDGTYLEDWGRRDREVEAYGVRVGVEGHVALGHETGWSFFGYAAASGLMTDVDAYWASDDDGDGFVDDAAEDHTDESSLGLEAGLGFQWAHTFDTEWTFGVKFGWEVSNYTDMAGDGAEVSASDDLGLNGGFVRFSFTF